MTADMELVREYASYQPEQAFEMLVVEKVTGFIPPHCAKEITQAVFIIFGKTPKWWWRKRSDSANKS